MKFVVGLESCESDELDALDLIAMSKEHLLLSQVLAIGVSLESCEENS